MFAPYMELETIIITANRKKKERRRGSETMGAKVFSILFLKMALLDWNMSVSASIFKISL